MKNDRPSPSPQSSTQHDNTAKTDYISHPTDKSRNTEKENAVVDSTKETERHSGTDPKVSTNYGKNPRGWENEEKDQYTRNGGYKNSGSK